MGGLHKQMEKIIMCYRWETTTGWGDMVSSPGSPTEDGNRVRRALGLKECGQPQTIWVRYKRAQLCDCCRPLAQREKFSVKRPVKGCFALLATEFLLLVRASSTHFDNPQKFSS